MNKNKSFVDNPPIIVDIIAVIDKMSRSIMHETFSIDMIIGKVSKLRTRSVVKMASPLRRDDSIGSVEYESKTSDGKDKQIFNTTGKSFLSGSRESKRNLISPLKKEVFNRNKSITAIPQMNKTAVPGHRPNAFSTSSNVRASFEGSINA